MRRRRDRDGPPPIEPWGAAPEPDGFQRVQRRGSPRVAVAIALAIVALVAAGLALDGGSTEPGAVETSTTTTTRRTTTRPATTRPTTTTTFPVGPVLQPVVEGTLVLGSTGNAWTWIDLATGEHGEVEVDTVDAWSAVAVRGGIVTIEQREAVFHPVPTGDPVSLGTAYQVFAGDDGTHVWLWPSEGSEPEVRATLVDLAGRVLDDVVVPQPWVNGSTAGGLVFNAGGRVYLARPDGIRAITRGEVHGVGPGGIVVRTCADDGRCEFRRFDAVRGTETVLELGSDPAFGMDVTVAADGRMVAVPYGPDESLGVQAFAPDGRSLGMVTDDSLQGRPVWLPGDAGLLLVTWTGVLHVSMGPEGLRSTELEALEPFRNEAVYFVTR